MLTNQEFVQELEKRLELFSFFHLGSDAEVAVSEQPGGLTIAISHRRVHPFVFRLSWEQVREFASNQGAFEDFMLDYLTRYRRS